MYCSHSVGLKSKIWVPARSCKDFLLRSWLILVSSYGRRESGPLQGLFYKDTNLIQGGSTSMPSSPSKVPTSYCDQLWGLEFKKLNLGGGGAYKNIQTTTLTYLPSLSFLSSFVKRHSTHRWYEDSMKKNVQKPLSTIT